MTLAKKPYLLKVLSGSHKGAEMLLGPGEYTIGSDHACDIIFSDQTIAPQHVQLVVTGADIVVKPIEQSIFVAGMPVIDTGAPLKPLQIVTMGSTHFSIGLPDADWSQLQSATFETTTVGSATSLPDTRKPYRLIKLYPWGGAGLLLCCMLVIIGQGNTKPIQPSSLVSLTPIEQIQRLVDDLNLPNLEVMALSNGRIKVQGYIKTAVQQQQLDNILRPFAGKVEKRLWIRANLVDSVNAVVRALGLRELHVTDGGPGTLVVTGYVRDEVVWQQALATLRRDIPSILRIEDQQIETLQKRRNILKDMLAQQGLDKKLHIQQDSDGLTVAGSLNSLEVSHFNQVAQTFRQRYGVNPMLNTQINQTQKKAQLAIRSVSVGNVPYLVTKEGHKYMEGTTLESGYKITSIKPDRIILSLNGIEKTQYLRSK
jgi:type III secretion system YscD/HrpQ family protein